MIKDDCEMKAIQRVRPTAKTSPVNWPALEKRINLKLSEENRQALLYALHGLVGREFEERDGLEMDRELRPYPRKARELAKLLRGFPKGVEGVIGYPAGDLSLLATHLSDLADRIERLETPKKGGAGLAGQRLNRSP